MAAPFAPSREPEPHASSTSRVVVTGIGLCTGLGMSAAETWANLKAGRSAVRLIAPTHAMGTTPWAGCPLPVGDRRWAGDILLTAASEAMADARFQDATIDRDRVGVVIGMSKGDLGRLSAAYTLLKQRDSEPDLESECASHWSRCWPSSAASLVAMSGRFQGPCLAPVAACATGLIAALQGATLIRRGLCDVVLAGAGDTSLDPLVVGAFRRMGILARVGPDPACAVRPWDRGRSGFLVGEGAAVLVLERDDHARARGVAPYAELSGGASGADAHHMTDLNPDPSALAYVIGRALANAGVAAGEIDHVNVHGTATRTNDPLECRALRRALGPQADRVACSANKSQIGHLLGAAGAAELTITCLAIRHGFVPPTLNLTDPDPACDLDGTPQVGRPREIGAALKLSIGFGGHLAAAVLKRVEERGGFMGPNHE